MEFEDLSSFLSSLFWNDIFSAVVFVLFVIFLEKKKQFVSKIRKIKQKQLINKKQMKKEREKKSQVE